jgi:hypothetical protein
MLFGNAIERSRRPGFKEIQREREGRRRAGGEGPMR